MTLPIPEKRTSQTSSTYQTQSWKWEKRHWLLILAVGCLALWWFSANLKAMPLMQKAIDYLPLIGSSAFALEAITKLAQ